MQFLNVVCSEPFDFSNEICKAPTENMKKDLDQQCVFSKKNRGSWKTHLKNRKSLTFV